MHLGQIDHFYLIQKEEKINYDFRTYKKQSPVILRVLDLVAGRQLVSRERPQFLSPSLGWCPFSGWPGYLVHCLFTWITRSIRTISAPSATGPIKVILKLVWFSVLDCSRFLTGSGWEEEVGVFMGIEMPQKGPHNSSGPASPLNSCT